LLLGAIAASALGRIGACQWWRTGLSRRMNISLCDWDVIIVTGLHPACGAGWTRGARYARVCRRRVSRVVPHDWRLFARAKHEVPGEAAADDDDSDSSCNTDDCATTAAAVVAIIRRWRRSYRSPDIRWRIGCRHGSCDIGRCTCRTCVGTALQLGFSLDLCLSEALVFCR